MVRDATFRDAQAIADIYNHYITNTTVTFEELPVTAAVMRSRIQQAHDLSLPWLVLEQGAMLVGYAYASRLKERSAYRYAVEVSVYLAHDVTRRGYGSALYATLFERLAGAGLHVAIGGITLPNDSSVALHEKFGMKKVAHFTEVGLKFDQWLDVGYWQKALVSRNQEADD